MATYQGKVKPAPRFDDIMRTNGRLRSRKICDIRLPIGLFKRIFGNLLLKLSEVTLRLCFEHLPCADDGADEYDKKHSQCTSNQGAVSSCKCAQQIQRAGIPRHDRLSAQISPDICCKFGT
jgi:hypothetical protein